VVVEPGAQGWLPVGGAESVVGTAGRLAISTGDVVALAAL